MKLLDMEFKNEKGKAQHIKLKMVKNDLDAPTVRASMNGIAKLEIFEKNDIKLYQEAVSAKYVETIETPVF